MCVCVCARVFACVFAWASVTQQLQQAPRETETNLMPPTCTHALIYIRIMNHGSHLGGKCS